MRIDQAGPSHPLVKIDALGSGSGRVVGAAMSRHGHEVAWHRVVLSSGHPNPAGPVEAMRRLKADGTPIAKGGERIDLALARWDGQTKSARR